MKFKDLEKRYFDTVFYFLMPTRSIIILCRIGTAGARVTTQDAIAVQARARRAFICAAGGRRHTANPIKRAIADTASVRPSPSGSAPTTAAPAWGQVAAGWFSCAWTSPRPGDISRIGPSTAITLNRNSRRQNRRPSGPACCSNLARRNRVGADRMANNLLASGGPYRDVAGREALPELEQAAFRE